MNLTIDNLVFVTVMPILGIALVWAFLSMANEQAKDRPDYASFLASMMPFDKE